jgi:hypothetical protein
MNFTATKGLQMTAHYPNRAELIEAFKSLVQQLVPARAKQAEDVARRIREVNRMDATVVAVREGTPHPDAFLVVTMREDVGTYRLVAHKVNPSFISSQLPPATPRP